MIDNTVSGGRVVRFSCNGDDVYKVLDKVGSSPIPHYIRRPAEARDKRRYQTVYAKTRGAVAAPTAGLHFTGALLKRVRTKGVQIVPLLLHVGLGTFRPVVVEDLTRHRMDSEYFEIPTDTALTINKAVKEKKRIVAVGTTSVRTLESAIITRGRVNPGQGWTDKFIYPPYDFKVVDALLTNFHMSASTMLMLVAAFADRDFVFRAYREAIRNKYRFYSYGDAMLIL